jgi:AraC family transcriptional regulator of adaptative response/methylated-DNA-[protein]-cysteine methyltransferase
VGLSPFHLHRQFKATLGITPKAYASDRRTRRLADGLARGRSVTRAIYAAGYNSPGRCYQQAADTLGMTPAKHRDGAPELRIRYAIKRSYLGCVLVAATDRGVCMIALGDTPDYLRQQLVSRFAKAELVGGDVAFSAWVAQVLAVIKSPGKALDLPLDIQGTAFQRRVWEALRGIPCGQTATYAEIAGRIGYPRAARAVAGACASNPLAVAIPCHRVIRGDGDLCGYRWGVQRKRALLDREIESAR